MEFLTFNVLIHTKSEQKVLGNWFWAPIIFKNPVKTRFSIRLRNIFLQFVSGVFWCNKIFLIRKPGFYGLLKVIGIQKNISCYMNWFILLKRQIFYHKEFCCEKWSNQDEFTIQQNLLWRRPGHDCIVIQWFPWVIIRLLFLVGRRKLLVFWCIKSTNLISDEKTRKFLWKIW